MKGACTYPFFILFSIRYSYLCNPWFRRVLKTLLLFPRMAVKTFSECSFVFGDVACRVMCLHIDVAVTQVLRNTFHSSSGADLLMFRVFDVCGICALCVVDVKQVPFSGKFIVNPFQ